MFKIDEKIVLDIIRKDQHFSAYDNVASTYYDGANNPFCKINFDNCLITIFDYSLGNHFVVIPDNLPLLSIEDKLKYNFPNDFYNNLYEDYFIILIHNQIKHLDTNIQHKIMKLVDGNVVDVLS